MNIILGGGCFWCLDAVYRQIEGVEKVVTGYAGVVEVVKLTFNPTTISLTDILDIFWSMHDPTSKDRQQYDVGPAYRSAIFYEGEQQRKVVEASLASAQKLFDKPIVTEIKPLEKFREAAPEHQDFYNSGNRPDYCEIVINPKLAKLRAKFAARLKNQV
jgi:peptide-methionine (S)-S-oxide reductase